MPLKNGKVSVALQPNVVGSVIPTGSIQAFMGTTAPSGWAFCMGQSVSRSTFSALFKVIGTTGGIGDGVTTFNIPDFRAVFLRGLDNGRLMDGEWFYDQDEPYFENGRGGLGSFQYDANLRHSHGIRRTSAFSSNGFATSSAAGTNISTQYVGESGTYESRPKNVAVNYIIKL